MLKSSAFVLGAALLAGISSTARADVQQTGSVNVAADHYTDISWGRFEGAVQRLRFVAEGDTIDCDHISVTYRDGTTHEVFSGMMAAGSTETITFPEGDSRMKHVDFACKARSVDGARIALSSVSDGYDADNWSRRPHVTTYESGQIIQSD